MGLIQFEHILINCFHLGTWYDWSEANPDLHVTQENRDYQQICDRMGVEASGEETKINDNVSIGDRVLLPSCIGHFFSFD